MTNLAELTISQLGHEKAGFGKNRSAENQGSSVPPR
jgi:hypothetical protein